MKPTGLGVFCILFGIGVIFLGAISGGSVLAFILGFGLVVLGGLTDQRRALRGRRG